MRAILVIHDVRNSQFLAVYGPRNCTIWVISAGARNCQRVQFMGPESADFWLFLELFLKGLFFFSTLPKTIFKGIITLFYGCFKQGCYSKRKAI